MAWKYCRPKDSADRDGMEDDSPPLSSNKTLHDPTTLQVPLAVAVETLRHAGEADPFCIPWEALNLWAYVTAECDPD